MTVYHTANTPQLVRDYLRAKARASYCGQQPQHFSDAQYINKAIECMVPVAAAAAAVYARHVVITYDVLY